MTVIGVIVAVVGILIVLVLWILSVLVAYSSIGLYRAATTTEATVIENMGNVKYTTGYISFGMPKFRSFYQYRISVNVDGKEQEVQAELAKRRLKEGDRIRVRYSITEDNEVHIVSTSRIHWAMEMTIGYTLGVILGVVLWIYHN